MEERAEQLKGISNLAALVAGFVMISYLQFGFDIQGQDPSVLISFGFTTAVVVRARMHAGMRSLLAAAAAATDTHPQAAACCAASPPRDVPPAADA